MPSALPRAGRKRGQSLVEFAIMAPLLLLILLFAIDFGRVFLAWVTVNNMARIGANYASLNPKGFEDRDPAISAQYRSLMAGDAAGINCVLPDPLPAPAFSGYGLGDEVQVDIECDFPLLTPFLSDIIGDGSGNIAVAASAIFNVRSGSVNEVPVNPPRITPPPASSSPDPNATPDPNVTPDPNATPGVTVPPVVVSFYGEPAPGQQDATGGGPPGSPNEAQIVGPAGTEIIFHNTTIGVALTCDWDFGDGATQSNCASTVAKIYPTRGTYTVTLTVNGVTVSRQDYVVISCKVPDFRGVRANSAGGVWAAAGFTGSVTTLPGRGNYNINYQSIVSGQVNPTGGCGASITVGP